MFVLDCVSGTLPIVSTYTSSFSFDVDVWDFGLALVLSSFMIGFLLLKFVLAIFVLPEFEFVITLTFLLPSGIVTTWAFPSVVITTGVCSFGPIGPVAVIELSYSLFVIHYSLFTRP